MTIETNITQNAPKKKNQYIALILCGIVFFVLLLLRDVYAVGINKNIFIVLTCLCAIMMKTEHLIYLFCFLFPLYVGLPGNYMTLFLLVRLFIDARKFRASSFIFAVIISAFVFAQNVITGYTAIVNMMFIAGVLAVTLLFTMKNELKLIPMVMMYSAGVATLGVIMLASTLLEYELSDLMSTAFRLGSSSMDHVDAGVMYVSADPNFYGLFSIAAISVAVPLIFKSKINPWVRIFLCCFTLMQVAVCLIGLSRSFILVFVVWMLLYLLSQRSIKGALMALSAVILIIFLVVNFMPDVLDTVLSRFKESDIATGNGRLTLIADFYEAWSKNIWTVLFGVGLFNCNVHCMPLQFLFGGGLVLFLLINALVISYMGKKIIKYTFAELLPIIVTFTMMCVVPAAGLLNYMFPLIFVGLVMRIAKSELSDRRLQ